MAQTPTHIDVTPTVAGMDAEQLIRVAAHNAVGSALRTARLAGHVMTDKELADVRAGATAGAVAMYELIVAHHASAPGHRLVHSEAFVDQDDPRANAEGEGSR